MSLMRRLLRTCTIALAAALPVSTVAAPPQMPVSVTADSGRFEQDAGSGLYRGNVELIQGKRKLFADEMRLFTRNGELIRVEASGTPVRMEEGEDLQAHANNLVYDIRQRTLVLTGDAYIEHLGNTFEGAKVEYSLDSKRVDASSEGDKRVRLVIPAENQTPKEDTPADNNANDEAPVAPSSEAEPNTP